MNKHFEQGFTLIELMIVVAIIGILAAIAIPQYSNYTSRTRAAAAKSELDALRNSVSICFNDTLSLTGCNSGTNGIPTAITNAATGATKNVTAATVANGVITATVGATTAAGVAMTVIDTPAMVGGNSAMTWTETGTICDATRGLKSGQGDCP